MPNLHLFLTTITDIGDSASLLAITFAGSLYLLSQKSSRGALFLVAAFLLSALVVSLLKIVFLGCQSYFYSPEIHSPSGHAALSATVFLAYAVLMHGQLGTKKCVLPLLLLTLLIAAIAMSRVLLSFHSAPEVFIGLTAGILSLLIAYALVLRRKVFVSFDAYALALCGVITAFLFNGTHLPAETYIHTLATHIHNHVPLCEN